MTISGTILDGFLYGTTPGLSSNVPGDHDLPQGARGGWLGTVPTDGTLTNNLPITIRALSKDGFYGLSFADDWYNRIHIAPSTINFGAVTDGAVRSSIIWNAYLSDSTLDDIVISGDEGLTLTGIADAQVLKPLQYVVINVEASSDGPFTVSAEYDFEFTDRPDNISLRVVGTRAQLWPFEINWRDPVDVNLNFLSDVITSESGREQRRALRRTPRRQLQFLATIDITDVRVLQRLLATWQSRPWVLGDPTRSVKTASGVASGSTMLVVDSLPAWLAADVFVLVGAATMTVDSIDEDTNTIIFTSALPDNVAAGAKVKPALQGRFLTQIQVSRPTSNTAEVTLTFDVDPTTEAVDEGAPGYALLEGREVFLPRPNWANAPTDSSIWPIDQVDYGSGKVGNYVPVEFNTFTRQQNFLAQSAADVTDVVQFFARQRGRRGEFLVPSYVNDIVPKFDLVKKTDFMRVAGTDIMQYDGDAVFQAVAVYMRNGAVLYRKIASFENVIDIDGNDTLIHFTTNWLVGYALADIRAVSWLTVDRFSTDQLTVEWQTSEVATIALNLTTLEYLTADNPINGLDGAAEYLLETIGFDSAVALAGSVGEVISIFGDIFL